MGRGRTTTAQIAAALVVQILATNEVLDSPLPPVTPVEDKQKSTHRLSWDEEGENIYLDGEYKAILQLVGILRHGKKAKRMADHAIDMMER
jgi:hypothetical protein